MNASPTQRVDPQAIECELDEVWSQLYADKKTGSLTRAAMSNLLVFCGDEAQTMNAIERIASLVEQHPSRVLILALHENKPADLQAWVSVHCRKVGEDQQLCAEHIELRFHPEGVQRAISVIRPLLIGDLPTALWWFSDTPPPLMKDVFDGLADLAHQVIYDSVGWSHPLDGVRAMTRWLKTRDQVVVNLAWRRLKAWRRMLVMGLDPEFNPGALTGLQEIDIIHGVEAVPLAWLLVSWLACRLNWQVKQGSYEKYQWVEWLFEVNDKRIRVRITRNPDGSARTIESMKLKWIDHENKSGYTRFYTEGHHLVTDENDSTITPITRPVFDVKLEQLVAAQMAHRFSDQLFNSAVKKASEMSEVLAL